MTTQQFRQKTKNSKKARIAFHILYDFHEPILFPIYNKLKTDFECLLTKDEVEIIAFKPKVLILADRHYQYFRDNIPETFIVWTRHGFANKNAFKGAISGCDFVCLSSEWVKRDCLKNNLRPQLDFWITGFPGVDEILGMRHEKPALPKGLNKNNKVLLYAPTQQPLLSSAKVLKNNWLTKIRDAFPDLNIIIKPHPLVAEQNPEWIDMWQKEVRGLGNVLLSADNTSSVYEYFPFADVMLSDASSVIFFFLAMNKPLILVNNPKRFEEPHFFDKEGPEWKWRDIGIEIENDKQLIPALKKSLNNTRYKSKERSICKEKVFGDMVDGKAAERIAGKITDLLVEDTSMQKQWVSLAYNGFHKIDQLNTQIAGINERLKQNVNEQDLFLAEMEKLRDSLPHRISRRLNRFPRIKSGIKKIIRPFSDKKA